MKKILFLVCALALYAFPAFAASPAHGQLIFGSPAPDVRLDPGVMVLFHAEKIGRLLVFRHAVTDKEKKALRLSGSWSRQGVEPVLTGGGKVVYVHGASLPTIVAAPMQVCDVELQPGETVHEIVVGDSSRWTPAWKAPPWSRPTGACITSALFPSVPAIRRMWAFCTRKA